MHWLLALIMVPYWEVQACLVEFLPQLLPVESLS
jgi:hypothetical protein